MYEMMMLGVVVAANVLGATMTVPQARQLYTTRRVAGISPTWAAMGIAMNGWWLAYGLGVGEVGILPVSVISVMCYIAIAAGLMRFSIGRRRATARALAIGLSTALAPVPFVMGGGWVLCGIALGAMYGVQLAPAVYEVYRRVDLTGVSLATWLLATLEAALWGVYAWPTRDVGVLALAVVGVTMTLAVIVRVAYVRQRQTATAFAPSTLAA